MYMIFEIMIYVCAYMDICIYNIYITYIYYLLCIYICDNIS